jgi:3D (Asp-Asp-Asp) domain-containing protein
VPQKDTSVIIILILFLLVSLSFRPAPEIIEVERIKHIYVDKVIEIPAPHTLPQLQFEATAYTAGPESTGKSRSHPAYGVTASGATVRDNHTLACPRSIPFGTQVYIVETSTLYTCEDRGGAIGEGKIDIYMGDLAAARAWGRRTVRVYIMP